MFHTKTKINVVLLHGVFFYILNKVCASFYTLQ